jgi:hypothetical protein
MKKIKELYVFDLDETFLRVPSYTTKKLIEEKHPYIEFKDPYEFYDNHLSLCDDMNHIQLIEPVFREWEIANADLSCAHALITHRVKSLKDVILSLLKKKGVSFDHNYFLGRVSEKVLIIDHLLKTEYDPTLIQTIKIFEDSIDQIYRYQKWFADSLNNLEIDYSKIDIQYWIVDKARMFRINEIELSDKRRITLI